MEDVARKLGDKLLSHKQLTQSQVKAAVEQARADMKRQDDRKLLRRLVTDAAFVVRLADDAKMRAELRRIGRAILEVCDETSQ